VTLSEEDDTQRVTAPLEENKNEEEDDEVAVKRGKTKDLRKPGKPVNEDSARVEGSQELPKQAEAGERTKKAPTFIVTLDGIGR
jgi:hypothetical protein